MKYIYPFETAATLFENQYSLSSSEPYRAIYSCENVIIGWTRYEKEGNSVIHNFLKYRVKSSSTTANICKGQYYIDTGGLYLLPELQLW